ncbi:MAG: LEA type 2 family protein [Treponema sp.]|nr:LEA type 2 family protein [Treponema sp.]
MKNLFKRIRTSLKSKIVFAGIILCALLTMTTCQTLLAASSILQDPVVSIHSVELANLSINGLQLLCKVQLENPNSFEISFPETDWELFVNANSFVSGTIRNNNRIRARNTTLVEVPVNLNFLEIINTFRSLVGSRQTDYKVALGVKFNLPVIGEKVWNLAHEGSIPMPQLPSLSAPTMTVGTPNLTGAEVVITLNFVNPNVFDIPSPKITYDYQINRTSFIRGVVENDTPLAASSTTPISFKLMVNYADLFRSFVTLLTAREVSTSVNLDCDFGIPIFSGQNITQQLLGSLPILR